MTLPTLINKNQERVTVTKVKKFYSVMNQALLMAIKDHGYVDEWNFTGTFDEETGTVTSGTFVAYLKPYLKLSKDCGNNKPGCIANQNYTLLNGTQHGNYDAMTLYDKMVLADGTAMWMRRDNSTTSETPCGVVDGGYSNVCAMLWIDVNGVKPPNTIGLDTFSFVILKNRIMPNKMDACKPTDPGWGCANYIFENDNMKYYYK